MKPPRTDKAKRKSKARAQFKERRLSVRITDDMYERLEAARVQSRRTLSGEVQFQLERAVFDWGTGPTHAVMTAIGRAIDSLARMQLDDRGWTKDDAARWWRDPYLFAQTQQAMLAALEMFKPQGEAPEGAEELQDAGGRRQGRFAIESIINDMQTVDPSTPPARKEAYPYWQWLSWLRRDLGFLADAPAIWGRSARARHYLKTQFAEFREELIVLTREAARRPEDMSVEEYAERSANEDPETRAFQTELEKRNLTPEKRRRLTELRRQLAELQREVEE